MSDRFQIVKADDQKTWALLYPDGFDTAADGEPCPSFTAAVDAFTACLERRCPQCGRGTVTDTEYGWKCRACGTYDIAIGCTPPKDPA
ncbi:hypothetical protein [Mycobacterium malmoense]|uniref:hypothetical protein n=1 Tax=Mycobacterium malmoense TaxID=1780 RepID=UPI0008F8673C|nr:hypothetical protein [Mycobacterium malmoense]OIN81645.1 hypothetical protein BMG05_06495 [Mycobacterium malmoense]